MTESQILACIRLCKRGECEVCPYFDSDGSCVDELLEDAKKFEKENVENE